MFSLDTLKRRHDHCILEDRLQKQNAKAADSRMVVPAGLLIIASLTGLLIMNESFNSLAIAAITFKE